MTHFIRRSISTTTVIFSASALLLMGPQPSSVAQGLSGPGQRLEETLGQSGGSNQAGSGGSQGPSAQQPGGGPPAGGGYGGPSGGGGPGGFGGPAGGGYGGPPSGGGYGDDGGYGDEEMDMEGYGDGGYGGGYGGPPSGNRGGRGRASGTPSADAMQVYGSSLISAMDGLNLSSLFAPAKDVEVESGPVLAREAEEAFKAGNHALALELMFGHMATEYEDALVALKTVKYSKTVRRPVWSIRWGVSMTVRGDEVDADPIRETTTIDRDSPGGGGRGPGGAGRGPGGGFGEQGYDEGYGEEMEQEMGDEQGMEEDYGMEMEMDMRGGGFGPGGPGARGGRGGAFGGGSRTASRPAIPQRKMLSEEANKKLSETIGLVATMVGEEFEKRYKKGDFGPLLTNISAPDEGETASTSMSAELNDVLNDAAESLPMWRPGIDYVGVVDSYSDAAKAAKSNGLDLLLHFDVALKPGRNSVQNISRCRLINVTTGKSVGVSKGMDNREAAQLASVGRMGERDYLEEQLSNLLAIIDRDVKVIDLPGLSPEVARSRIATLISSPTSRSLRTLAEIRLYQAQNLLNEQEVEAAFDIVGGAEGLTLLHAADEQRIEMARKWATGADQ